MEKNRIIAMIFILSLLIISGCKAKKDVLTVETVRVGTEGIALSFGQGAPPDLIQVEEGDTNSNSFEILIEARNKGAYPQLGQDAPSTFGNVYLSGFDKGIIQIEPSSYSMNPQNLEGKSTINTNGGLDIIIFKGTINANLIENKYDPTILATACYTYETIAAPQICIDPDPYSTINRKVCTPQEIALTGQGAPVAVTKVVTEAFAKKTQFRIWFKNVGGGEIIKKESINKCTSTEKLAREDFDKIMVDEVKLASTQLTCGPFNEGGKLTNGVVRMINNEGSIICEIPSSSYAQTVSAYTTPLKISLSYGYKSVASKKIMIKKEGASSGASGDFTKIGGSSGSTSSSTTDNSMSDRLRGGP